jgi:hypothetical protein
MAPSKGSGQSMELQVEETKIAGECDPEVSLFSGSALRHPSS